MVPARTRRATVVTLTVLSIALAEVSIGSSPWGLLNPLGWLLLVPIYGAQTVLVGTAVLRRQAAPTLAALWSAGVVMGLYEFYITRVLWDSPWDSTVNALPVEPLALVVVAGFYHPFVSVFLPLALTEQVVTGGASLWALLPRPLRAARGAGAWALVVAAGVVAGGLNRPAGPVVLVTLPLSAAAVWAVVRWARRAPSAPTLVDALPGRRGLAVAWVLVALVFAPFVALAVAGPDGEPWPRHAAALACYAVAIALAWSNLRHASRGGEAHLTREPRAWRAAVAAFLAAAAVGVLVPGGEVVGVVAIWGGGGIVALAMLVRAAAGAVRPSRARV